MLRKESRDALKRFVECLFILIGVPLAYLWDRFVVKFGWDFLSLFRGVLAALVFIFAAYAGATIFWGEKKDQAFEYLLSLPVSRARIIASKILPRFGLLVGLYAVLAILTQTPFLSLSGIMLAFIFFISVFLSLIIESVVVGLLGILLLFGLYYFSLHTFSFIAWKLHLISSLASSGLLIQLLSAIILLLPFGAAFLVSVHRLDAKPLSLQVKPYYLISLPALLVILFLIMMFYGDFLASVRRG
jgi:ABC-type Na+ efflux pump permease subunit